jgi:hypothetical protein
VPIVVTFDLIRPEPLELNRLRGAFERLGWQRLGNTAYRYPRLGARLSPEDWLNHVIPALMLLRAYSRSAARAGRGILRFTVDAHVSTGCGHDEDIGLRPQAAGDIEHVNPSRPGEAMGREALQLWLDGIAWPYEAPPAEGGA